MNQVSKEKSNSPQTASTKYSDEGYKTPKGSPSPSASKYATPSSFKQPISSATPLISSIPERPNTVKQEVRTQLQTLQSQPVSSRMPSFNEASRILTPRITKADNLDFSAELGDVEVTFPR